jgi:hypothetical protein
MLAHVHGARVMKVLCAWCGLLLKAGPPAPVSHGMCAACAKKFNEDLDEMVA